MAEKYCQQWAGNLASIKSKNESNRLEQRYGLKFRQQSYWIGLSKNASNESYQWTDGTSYSYELFGNYSKSITQSGDQEGQGKICVELTSQLDWRI